MSDILNVSRESFPKSEVTSKGMISLNVECDNDATFYAVEGAHHGGREFWSSKVLDIIEGFIKKYRY